MIFVTVGTHEQPFNRLVQKIDNLKRDGVITDDVVIQTGFSTYEPKYCKWQKLFPYQDMGKDIKKLADLIRDYEKIADGMRGSQLNNNEKFCAAVEKMAEELVWGKRSE